MNDESRGLLAIALSVVSMAATGMFSLLQWRGGRTDRREDTVRQDFDRYHQLWEREAKKADLWERRFRAMDAVAHEMRNQILNERVVAETALLRAELPLPIWKECPMIPDAEELCDDK